MDYKVLPLLQLDGSLLFDSVVAEGTYLSAGSFSGVQCCFVGT